MKIVKTHVMLNGKDVGVHPVKWVGAIGYDLPGRFSAHGEVPLRTGEIAWVPESALGKDISPLDETYPSPGDEVVITAVVTEAGLTEKKQVFVGQIDSTRGGMGKPLVSEIIDTSDKLSAPVTIYPRLTRMPRRQNTWWRAPRPGSHVASVLADVAQQCGFGVEYPHHRGRTVFRAHLVNTFFTHYLAGEGALVSAGDTLDAVNPPDFAALSTGERGLRQGYGGWDKNGENIAWNGLFIEAEIIGISDSTRFTFGVRIDSGETVFIHIDGGSLNISTKSGQRTWIQRISGTQVIGLYYPPTVGESLWVRVGDKYIQTSLTRGSSASTLQMTTPEVTYTADNAPIFLYKSGGGVARDLYIGSFSGTQGSVDSWRAITGSRVPNRVRFGLGNIPITPYIPGYENVSGKEVLQDICKAWCISSWIDGTGNLNFIAGDILRDRAPSLTLTESDYAPISFESKFLHAASYLHVTGKYGEVAMYETGNPALEVWSESSSESFDSTDEITYWVKISDDEDYFEVDTSPKNLNQKYDDLKGLPEEQFWSRRRREKWWWGWYSTYAVAKTDIDSATAESRPVIWIDGQEIMRDSIPGTRLHCTVEQVALKTFKVRLGWDRDRYSASKPQMPQEILDVLQLNDATSRAPVLRAGAKVSHVAAPVEKRPTGGPAGPTLAHDMGIWAGYGGSRYMADLLAAYFSTAHPVLPSITTAFNPSIEEGKCINIDASRRWGAIFKVLVLEAAHDDVAGTTTFTPRVVSFLNLRKQYKDLEGGSYAGIEGSSYAEVST